ncbi:uncharacterized protein LAESUDRAFT_785887 [Laetiporus sulphureus 93-53]|uniref:Uncharacterized protein n=1 Tax=Laetiporus sulphureus 93-53 TaxID=1314785 RepID=A0A165D9M8_9APHY|nr:uncharacterized protein LAESUDRAFT_785887 [Laetiporus sulphureus 93-53]KZT04389.1 hypothetical protein LAESUDRAFT_785887 [Laetiporus sulphureus 93-53]
MPLSRPSVVVVSAAAHNRPANTPKRPLPSMRNAAKKIDRPQHPRVDTGSITPLSTLKRRAHPPRLRSIHGPMTPHRLATLSPNKAEGVAEMAGLIRGMQDGGRSSNVTTREVLPERTYASVVKSTDKIGRQVPQLGAVSGIRGAVPSRAAAHHRRGTKKSLPSGDKLPRSIRTVGRNALDGNGRMMQRNIRGGHKARPVQNSALNATSSRRKRMPPRPMTDILPDPRLTNWRTSSGQRGSASTIMVYSKSDWIQRPNTPGLLVQNNRKQASADGDELTDTANRTAIWLLQSATDVDWAEFSRVRANTNEARQIASRKTGDQMKGFQTVIPACKYKPSRTLTYLHSDLHLHQQAGQRWKTMSVDERHEATMKAFSNGSVEATKQAISTKQLSAHETRV